MNKDVNIVKKLKILPRLMKVLTGDFIPQSNYKLKKTESKTLMEMRCEEGKSMSYYCEKVDLENGSFTYLADKLEKKGLIKRVFVEGDRRKKVLMLTDEGHKVTEDTHNQFERHLATKLQVLEEEELDKLLNAIEILEGIKHSLLMKNDK